MTLDAERGVTLIELVVVIVLTSILLAMMAYFAQPLLQYSEASRRATLTSGALATSAITFSIAGGTRTVTIEPQSGFVH